MPTSWCASRSMLSVHSSIKSFAAIVGSLIVDVCAVTKSVSKQNVKACKTKLNDARFAITDFSAPELLLLGGLMKRKTTAQIARSPTIG
jgi:hypothetical protein